MPRSASHQQSRTRPTATAAVPAVIYCRVSSQRQLLEGNGLAGQEKRCRDYAQAKGYPVVAVFREQAFTGDLLSRPAMKELLAFLAEQREGCVVLVDDLKRFARNVETHFALKVAVFKTGARLESPGFRFEDTPEGKFVETVIAGAAELERNQNRQQVLNRMRARLELGHWPFRCPVGYVTTKHPVHKKALALDRKKAPLVKEALEGYTNGRFAGIADVQRFLAERGHFRPHRDQSVCVDLNLTKTLLRQVLYAGYVEYAPWGVSLRRGHHPALITLDTFERIQDKLAGRGRTMSEPRRDSRPEFPLRGFVRCAECGEALTASSSTGRFSKRYAYYHCCRRFCALYGKTVPAERLEGDFEALLRPLGAKPEVLAVAEGMMTSLWRDKCANWAGEQHKIAQRAHKAQTEVDALVEKLVLVSAPAAIAAIEERIASLEAERDRLSRQAERSAPPIQLGTALARVFPLLEKPYQTWKAGSSDDKRLVTTLVFTERLAYGLKTGFGTADLSLPYLLLARPEVDRSMLVDYEPESWNHLTETLLHWVTMI